MIDFIHEVFGNKNKNYWFFLYDQELKVSAKESKNPSFFFLCDLYGTRDFGFVRLCQLREHFLFIMVCVSLMDGLTGNKAWRKPRVDIDFRLKESQPYSWMVSILVLNFKLVRHFFQIQLVLEDIFSFFNQEGIDVMKSLY